MFVIARSLLGFGILLAIVAASSMIGERAYLKERARIGSLFNASWFIGTCFGYSFVRSTHSSMNRAGAIVAAEVTLVTS